MENKRALVAQLHQYRKEHRLSALDIAKKLGVTEGTVYGWERSRRQPSDINVWHIKKLLRGV